MVRGVKKENLPSKVCVVCHRPFTWRKKWEDCWDDVTTCSKSCNRKRRAKRQAANRSQRLESGAVDDGDESVDVAPPQKTPGGNPANSSREKAMQIESFHRSSSHRVDEENEMNFQSMLSPKDQRLLENGSTLFDADVESTSSSKSRASSSSTIMDLADVVREQHFDEDGVTDAKAARKAAKKQMKALKRKKRQGLDPRHGQKPCSLCGTSVDLLIRCTIDETETWNMVCGKCWHSVSGGVVDGDKDHPHYRYGGLWKNRARKA